MRIHPKLVLSLLFIGAVGFVLAKPMLGGASKSDIILTLKDNKFDQSEINIPAGKAVNLVIKNEDDTPEEIECAALHIEKIVRPHGTRTIAIPPLVPGRYELKGEYHDSARSALIVK